ncbi:hypothetical protein [Brevundimonas naejangsanensis]|uniref:hypothetical protein n=1 Tax=Brevundimonas naejangsanensis TaxID=588932 RepID=UPI0026ED6C9D|nr:hypothetical protein [Brevundimonas naejangsanensis]
MAADGALSNEDIDFILDGVMRRAQRKGKPFHREAIAEAAAEMTREEVIGRALERRMRVAQQKAAALFDEQIGGMGGVGDLGDRFRAYWVGSEQQGKGGSFSVEAEARGLQSALLTQVARDLREAGLFGRVTGFRQDKALELDVAREMSRMNGGPDAPTGNAEAMRIAEIFNAANERARLLQNDQGAWIGKLDGWIVRQAHDPARVSGGFWREAAAMRSGARPGDVSLSASRRAFRAWRDETLPLLDERTFDGIDGRTAEALDPEARAEFNGAVDDVNDPREAFLYDIWWSITHGKLDQLGGADDLADYRPPASLARSVSKGRTLHFKNADAWMTYNDAFGGGSLFSMQMAGLSRAAMNTALLRRAGPSPEAMFQAKRAQLLAQARAMGDTKAASKLNAAMREREFAELTGGNSRPENLRLAQVGRAVRIWQVLTKLGGVALSSMSDTALTSQTMKRAGGSFLEGYGAAFGGLARLGDAEAKQAADLLDVSGRAMASAIAGRFVESDGIGGLAGAMTRLLYKVQGFTFMQDGIREGFAQAASRLLGQQADRAWDALEIGTRETMERYGISAAEWDLARRGLTHPHQDGVRSLRRAVVEDIPGDEPGRLYWTFEALDGIDDKDLLRWKGLTGKEATADAARRARYDLKVKFQAMVNGMLDDALTEPRARERVQLTGLTGQPGTVWGEFARTATQFLSFSQAIVGRHVVPALRGYAGQHPASLMAHLILSTTLLGYMQMQAKMIAAGKQPRGFTDENGEFQGGEIFIASLLAGGGLGIYGDLLFGEANRSGLGFTVGAMMGPAVSEVERAMTITRKLASGDPEQLDDLPGDLTRAAKANTPFGNLWLTRAGLDYLLWLNLQEAVSPGSVERYERNVEREQNTQFLISPGEWVN